MGRGAAGGRRRRRHRHDGRLLTPHENYGSNSSSRRSEASVPRCRAAAEAAACAIMADAPMGDNGDWEAELARRVEAARADLRAQLEGEWRGRVENADRGLAGAAQAAPPPPRNFANHVARPSHYDGRAQSLNDWLFTFKLFLRATGVEPGVGGGDFHRRDLPEHGRHRLVASPLGSDGPWKRAAH